MLPVKGVVAVPLSVSFEASNTKFEDKVHSNSEHGVDPKKQPGLPVSRPPDTMLKEVAVQCSVFAIMDPRVSAASKVPV